MKTNIKNIEKIHEIARFICKNGKLVNVAKSCWGADRWELGLLAVTLEDDGYTTCVHSENLGLRVADSGGTIHCRKGKIEDLDTLYGNLFDE
jgi:hypothetical protein